MSRRRQRAGVFGLLAAAWLCLGLQPCAIAADAHEDCPHCPPEHSDESHAVHAAHKEHVAAKFAAHAAHAGMPQLSPCSAMQADCCDAGFAAIDSRASERKLDHDDRPAAALPAPVDAFSDAYPPRAERATDPPPTFVASRPLHKLYCVYRD